MARVVIQKKKPHRKGNGLNPRQLQPSYPSDRIRGFVPPDHSGLPLRKSHFLCLVTSRYYLPPYKVPSTLLYLWSAQYQSYRGRVAINVFFHRIPLLISAIQKKGPYLKGKGPRFQLSR